MKQESINRISQLVKQHSFEAAQHAGQKITRCAKARRQLNACCCLVLILAIPFHSNMNFVLLLAALLRYVSADNSHTFEHIKTTSQSGSISQKVDHVIMMIIDGLRPDYMSGKPNFDWLMANGVCTMNARHDPVTSQTLPNHIDSKWRQCCAK